MNSRVAAVLGLLFALFMFFVFWPAWVERGISHDPRQLRAWLREMVGAGPPVNYDCKYGFNAAEATGVKAKMVLVLPSSFQLPEGPVSPEQATAIEVLAFPEVKSSPELFGFYKRMRAKHKLASPPNGQGITTRVKFPLQCGTVQAIRSEWNSESGVALVRLECLVKSDVLVTAVGPQSSFDDEAVQTFLEGMDSSRPTVY